MIGKRLAQFEVVSKIGAGGMGEVYRARDVRLEREVALKILPAAMAGDPDRRARFEREARAIAALHHPNVVTIHSVEEVDGVLFLAMELVEGRTLSETIPPQGMALGAFLDVAIPLADAVAAAHARGITHRDLKPDNVMIEPDGRVKVLDFGLAKLFESGLVGDGTVTSGPAPTREGRILGTVAYMSPEQAEGKPVDARSDVFSLGILMYEMITGEKPFRGDTQISTITSILRDTPEPVHGRKPGVPGQVDRILQRCLEKAPDARYESARGIRDDLESLRTEIRSLPPGAKLRETGSPGGPARARRIAAGALVAGLVVLGGGAWLFVRVRGEQAPASPPPGSERGVTIVVFPFENMGPAGDEYFAAGIADEITSRLAALQGVGVLSRTSAAQYDRKGKTMQRIASDLGVDYVLDGTVRWARGAGGASQVRITPQLVRASEDRQVWSASYDRSPSEIFRIQSEIAGAVVDRLGVALLPKQRDALATAPTKNVEAYDAYLRAHEIINGLSFSVEDFDRAVGLLEAAVAKDPEYLRAWAELAKAHAGYLHFGWDISQDRLARSKAAVDRALALDPASPWSQMSLGYYHYWGRKDYATAYQAFSKAEELLPGSTEPRTASAYVLRRQGRYQEAADRLEKTTALDPRNAMVFFTLGETQAILRRYDEADRSFARAIAVAPTGGHASATRTRVALLAGDLAAARAALAAAHGAPQGSELRGLEFWNAVICRDYDRALAYAAAFPEIGGAQFDVECRPLARGWVRYFRGDRAGARAEFERARSLLQAMVRDHPDDSNSRSALALALAHLGESDAALREARKALELFPSTQDAWVRQFRRYDVAVVDILTGRHDEAIAILQELMREPSDQVSVGLLRLSPVFDPLRGSPAFERLVASKP